jgi:hypothetical protein
MILDLVCKNCGLSFKRSRKRFNDAKRMGYVEVFCSRKCVAQFQSIRYELPCGACGKMLSRVLSSIEDSKSGKVFCSTSCAAKVNLTVRTLEKHPNYTSGIGSYRRFAFDVYGRVCTICGYSIECVLQVHHRDGDRKNNKIENLDVLCPTHHYEFERGIRKYEEVSVGDSSNC